MPLVYEWVMWSALAKDGEVSCPRMNACVGILDESSIYTSSAMLDSSIFSFSLLIHCFLIATFVMSKLLKPQTSFMVDNGKILLLSLFNLWLVWHKLLFFYFVFLSFVITQKQYSHTLEFRVKIVFYYRNLITSYVGLEVISIVISVGWTIPLINPSMGLNVNYGEIKFEYMLGSSQENTH